MYIKIFFVVFSHMFLYTSHQLDFNDDANNIFFNNKDVKSNILKIYLGDQSYEDINLDILMKNMQNVFYYLESINSDLLNDVSIKMLFYFCEFFLTFNGKFDKISKNPNYNINLQKFIQKMLSKNVCTTMYNEYLLLILIIENKTLSNSEKFFRIENLFSLFIFEDDKNYANLEKIIKDNSINNTQKYEKIEFFIRNTLTNEKFYKTIYINDNYRYLIGILNEIKNNKLDKTKVSDMLLDELITKIISILICDYVYKFSDVKRLRGQKSFDNAEIMCTILYALEDKLNLPGHNQK